MVDRVLLAGMDTMSDQSQGQIMESAGPIYDCMLFSSEEGSPMLSSNITDAFEVTERPQPKLEPSSQCLNLDQKSSTSNAHESQSSGSTRHPITWNDI